MNSIFNELDFLSEQIVFSSFSANVYLQTFNLAFDQFQFRQNPRILPWRAEIFDSNRTQLIKKVEVLGRVDLVITFRSIRVGEKCLLPWTRACTFCNRFSYLGGLSSYFGLCISRIVAYVHDFCFLLSLISERSMFNLAACKSIIFETERLASFVGVWSFWCRAVTFVG